MTNRFKQKKILGLATVKDYLAEARQYLGPVDSNTISDLEVAIGYLIDAIDMIAHKRSPGAGSGQTPPAGFIEGWEKA